MAVLKRLNQNGHKVQASLGDIQNLVWCCSVVPRNLPRMYVQDWAQSPAQQEGAVRNGCVLMCWCLGSLGPKENTIVTPGVSTRSESVCCEQCHSSCPYLCSRALRPPGWLPQWHCGVRVVSSRKLVGFISAIPANIHIYDT